MAATDDRPVTAVRQSAVTASPRLPWLLGTREGAITTSSLILLFLVVIFLLAHASKLLSKPGPAVQDPTICPLTVDMQPRQTGNHRRRDAGLWPDSPGAMLCDCSEISEHLPWGCTIMLLPTGYLDFETNDEVLLRYFSPKRVADFKTALDERITAMRSNALDQRRAALDAVAHIVFRHGFDDSYPLPEPLRQYRTDTRQRISGHLGDDAYIYADLDALMSWLQRLSDARDIEQKLNYQPQIDALQQVKITERTVTYKILTSPLNLDDTLSFRWLRIENGQWLFELAFLAWMGVLVQTLVALIEIGAPKSERPLATSQFDPRAFMFLFPRLLMAPIVAIVVLAMVSAGITGIEVTISNLPVFLFFAFILGFANDRLVDIIRRAVKYFIPRLGVRAEKVAEQYGEEARTRARRQLTAFRMVRDKPENMSQLRLIAKDRARLVMAQAIARAKQVNEERQS